MNKLMQPADIKLRLSKNYFSIFFWEKTRPADSSKIKYKTVNKKNINQTAANNANRKQHKCKQTVFLCFVFLIFLGKNIASR